MGLYTAMDKQIENYYEVVSINDSISKQSFYFKILVLLLFAFNVSMIIKKLFLKSEWKI